MEIIVDFIYFIIAAAVAVIFIYVMVSGYLHRMKTVAEPMYTVKAKLSGKRIGETAGGSDDMPGKAGAEIVYFATFANSEGVEKELRVTKTEYEALTVGMNGTLVFRGDVMLSFEAASGGCDEDEVEANEE